MSDREAASALYPECHRAVRHSVSLFGANGNAPCGRWAPVPFAESEHEEA